jgi:TP901 family phage tail tape measure protein
MADVNSNIFINIDTAQAMSALRGLDKQLSAFNRSMIVGTKAAQAAQADFTRSLLHNVNATGAFTGSMTKMSTATDQFTERLQRGRLSLREYYRYGMASTRTFGRSFGKEFETVSSLVERRVKTLQTQYVGLGRDAQGAINAMSMTPKKLNYNDQLTRMQMVIQRQQILNKLLADGSVKLLNFGKNTQWAGRQLMVGFTIPLAMFAASAVKSFKEIETQALRFKKVYGELFTTQEETEAALKNMQKLADEYTKYGLKVAETIKTAGEAAAAGFAGNDLDVIVRQANKLAVLGGVAQDQSLETIIALKNAFGITTEELGKNIDFLNAVENQTVLTIEDLTKAIPRVAPVIRQLGGDVKDLSFFLTAMKEGGVSAEQGANALKSGLASLINPSTAAVKATNALGINLKAIVETNAGDLKQTVLEFAQSISTLNDLQRGQVIEKIFGKYQFARLSAMFNNITKEGTQANRVMKLATASAEELAILSQREMKLQESSSMNKMQAQIEKLKAAIAPVGELFAKVLTPVIEFFVKLFDKFNQLPDGVKKAVALIVAGIAGIGPVVLMTVGLVANGIANLMKMFNLVRQGYQRLAYGSKDAALSTRYMSQEELQNTAVTNSLTTSHQNLSSAYVLEASSLRALTAVYQQANAAMSVFARNNPGMFMPGIPRGGGVAPRKYNKGVSYVPGTGNKDTVPAVLTPGEAVIPKPMVAKYGGLVNAMVKDQIPGYMAGYYPSATSQVTRLLAGQPGVVGRVGGFGAAGAIGGSTAARRLATIELSPGAVSSRVMQRVGLDERGDLISVTMGGAQFFVKKSKYKDLESVILQNEKYQTSKGASVDDILATMVSRISAPHRNLLGATVSPSRIKSILPLNPTTSAVSKDAKSRRIAYKDKQAYLDLQAYYKQEESYVRQKLSIDDLVALTAPRAKFEGERLKDVISRTGDKGLFSLSSALSHGTPAKTKIRSAEQDSASNLYEETNQMNLAYAYNKNRAHVKSEAEAKAFMNELIEKKNKTAFDRYAIAALDKRIKDKFYDRFKTRQDELLMANKGVLTPGGSYGNIPAVLTPGEAVLSKDVVNKYQPLITAMSEGTIPGYMSGVMLGMPASFAKTQQMRASQAQLEAAVAKSRLAKTAPTDFGHLVQPFSGRSFPIPGVGGVYRKPNGELVVVKPAVDEKSALAEIRATQIAREAHGLDSPKQSIKTMIDPSDPTGKRKLIVLESPYNKKFAEPTGKFTKQQYIRQLVAASLRGDKDLSMSNLSGNMLADVGTAGVFSKASGFRDFAKTMPSMEDQAVINLLGVKGGAKKFFAETTAPIASKMSAQEFESMMLAEINTVLPKLKKTISSFKLGGEESKVYADMIARLEAGKKADWKKIHGIHTNVKPKKYKNGVVSVPGPKGAGDIMPAMLAPGEAVIPAKMTEKYSPLISGMINDSIPGFKYGPGNFNPDDPWDDKPRLLGPDGRPLPPSTPGTRNPSDPPIPPRGPDRVERAIDKFFDKPGVVRFGKKWDKMAAKFAKAGPPIEKTGNAISDTTRAFEKDKTRGFTGWMTGYGRVSDTVQNEDGSSRRATQAERANMRQDARMQSSQKGMNRGMVAMMVPMAAGAYAQKNPDSGIAKNMDMIMMISMLVMLLPMLNSPLKLLIGTVAGLAIVYKMQSAAIKKSLIEGEKQGRAMIMATGRLEELGKITGTVSKTQIAAEKRKSRNTDLAPVSIEFGNKVIEETDFGKNLKASFEQTVSDPNLGREAGINSLVSQLGTAVSQGLLTNAQAESIAITLTRKLKDVRLELDVRGRLIELLGPNGEKLVSNPLQVQVDLLATGISLQDAAVANLNKVASQQVGVNTKGEFGQLAAGAVGGGFVAAKAGIGAANMMAMGSNAATIAAAEARVAKVASDAGKVSKALAIARNVRVGSQLASAGAAATGVGTIPGLVGLAVSTVVFGGIEAGIRNWQKGKEKAAIAKASGIIQGITSQNLAASMGSVDVLTAQYDTAIANLELKKKTLKTEQDRNAIDEQIKGLETQKQSGLKTLRSTQAMTLGSVSSSYQKVSGESLLENISPFGSGRGQVRDKFMESFAVGLDEKFKDNPILKAQASALQSQLDTLGKDEVTLEISALVTSDILTPSEASAMVSAITNNKGDITKDMQAVVDVQGLDGLQRLSTLLTMIPNENNQKNLFVAIKQMNKTDGDAVMTAIEQLGIIPPFIGIELEIETQKSDTQRLKSVGKEIDALKKQFPDGKISLEALVSARDQGGKPGSGIGKNLTLDAAIAQWTEISKLPREIQFQAMITIGSISQSDNFDDVIDRELEAAFLKQNPKFRSTAGRSRTGERLADIQVDKDARAKALKAFKEDTKNVEKVIQEYFKKTVPQLFPTAVPPIVPPGGGGTDGTKTKKDTSWLSDLTQRLKIVKDSSIDATNALDPLKSIRKFLGKDIAGLGGGSVESNKSLNKQLGAIQEIDVLAQNKNIRGLSDDFREILVNMDPEQFDLWSKILFKVGTDGRLNGLTQDFIDINSAFRTATIGEYIENEKKAVDEIRNRVSAYYTLTDLAKQYGFSVADTNKLLQNQSLVTDIASGMQYSKEELAGLIDINKQARKELSREATTTQLQETSKIQIQIDAFKKLQAEGIEYETILQIISRSEWAESVASSTGEVTNQFSDLIKSAKDYKKVVFELSQLTETDATKLDQRFAAEAARITAKATADFRKINLMSVEQFNAITREKEISQRGFQDQIDTYNDGISEIEKLEQSVNDKYDAKAKLIDEQVAALDKVRSINEDIAAQQQNQLTLADALTQGDISAAAKAAADYSTQQAEVASRNASEALDEQRAAMEVARQKQIDDLRTKINGKEYTRKQLTAEIAAIQETHIDKLEKEIEARNRLVSAHEDANTKALANVEINKMTASEWEIIKGAATTLNEAYDAQVINIDEIATSVGGVSAAWDAVTTAIKNASLEVGKYPLSGSEKFATDKAAVDKKAAEVAKQKQIEAEAIAKANAPLTYNQQREAQIKAEAAKVASDAATATALRKLTGNQSLTDTEKKLLGISTTPTPVQKTSAEIVAERKAKYGYLAMGGLVPKYFAAGGYSKGTDTVPAMLTPGEFIVKKNVADQYRSLLESLNNGTYRSFEAPTYSSMNNNVKVGAGATGSSADNSSKVYNYNVGISVNNTNANADDIAKAVMSEIRYIDSQRLRGQR